MAANQPSAEKISLETINQCSDISKLHDIYDNLLRYGNKSPNLTKVAREKLIGMHRFSKAAAALNPNEEKLIAKIVAAAEKEFKALTKTELHRLMKKHLRELGLEESRQKWVAEVFEPNTQHDLTNEAMKIQHTRWLLSIKMYLLSRTKRWNALSNAARDVAMWKMRDSMSVIRQEHDAHTRSLPDGNIVIEMADGTTSSSWIPNQGEMATPGVTTALAFAHYGTENEKEFVQKSAFVDGRLVEDSCHRMARKVNPSLRTLDGTSIRHAMYHTAKEEESPVAWDDIDVDQYSKKLAIMDKDSIILQKPIKGLKDGNDNTVSDEKQLKDQRIRYAEACNYEQVGSLKKEDLSEFNSLATFAFNVQVIEATTREPAAVIAVGAQAKKTFREKGEKPFVTSLIRYYGWIYHPESMNRVRVTDLVRAWRKGEKEVVI